MEFICKYIDTPKNIIDVSQGAFYNRRTLDISFPATKFHDLKEILKLTGWETVHSVRMIRDDLDDFDEAI